jgi:hypothetical protein
MRVGLVSCVRSPSTGPGTSELTQTLSLAAEHADVDLLLFAGWTLMPRDYQTFLRQNENHRSIVVMQEVADGFPPVHVLQGRRELNTGQTPIAQLFANGKEAGVAVLERLLDALENERRFDVAGKTARLIICGENNLLKNFQSDGNRVAFRDRGLVDRFERIRGETDVFLNPAHTPMGELGKLTRRWSYLSDERGLCLFTTNATDELHLGQKRLQYAFGDGRELVPIETPAVRAGQRLAVYDWGF